MTVSDWRPDSPATIGRDATDSPPSVAVAARTPVPADTEERDGGEALSGDLARVLVEAEGFEQPAHVHYAQAAAVLAAGYRLVSEDDTTVERVARALWRSDIADVPVSDTDANWAIARGPVMAGFAALVHRTCGHICAGPSNHRRMVEAHHKLLAAAGYHQWRVRTVELTEDVLMRVVACDTCRIDPTRGLLPSVVEAQRSDPDVREAAALGAAAHVAALRGDQLGGRS